MVDGTLAVGTLVRLLINLVSLHLLEVGQYLVIRLQYHQGLISCFHLGTLGFQVAQPLEMGMGAIGICHKANLM